MIVVVVLTHGSMSSPDAHVNVGSPGKHITPAIDTICAQRFIHLSRHDLSLKRDSNKHVETRKNISPTTKSQCTN